MRSAGGEQGLLKHSAVDCSGFVSEVSEDEDVHRIRPLHLYYHSTSSRVG